MSRYNPSWGRDRGRGRGSAPAATSSSLTPTATSFFPRQNTQPQIPDLSQPMASLNLASSPSLLANYFEIKLGKFRELYRYELRFRKLSREESGTTANPAKKLQTKGKGEGPPAPNPAGDATITDAGIGRAKQRRIVWLVMQHLQHLNIGKPLATDYGTEVISTDKIRGDKNSHTITIEYFDEYQRGPSNDCEVFEVTLEGPAILSLTQLMEFLSTNTPNVNAANYQSKEATIRALNTIFSYRPYRKCFASLTPQGAMQDASLTTINGNKFYGIMRVTGDQPNSDTGKPLQPKPKAGLDAIAGYARSVRAVISQCGQLYLNIDTATALFYQRTSSNNLQALIDVWKTGYYPQGSSWDPLMRYSLIDFLRGIRVRTNYRGGSDNLIGRVTNLANTRPPNQVPFPRNCPMIYPGSQSNQTVANHFQAQYPASAVNQRSEDIVVVLGDGAFQKTVPASCLEVIPGQVNRNVTEKPKAGIRNPIRNRDMILPGGRDVFFTSTGDQSGARQFDFDLAAQLVRVPIVKLDHPSLRYRQHRDLRSTQTNILPEKRSNPGDVAMKYGAWNLKDRSFFKPASSFNWTYIELTLTNGHACSRDSMTAFGNGLMEQLKKVGMTHAQLVGLDNHQRSLGRTQIAKAHDEAGIRQQHEAIRKVLIDLKARHKLRLVVLVLPSNDAELYSAIKRAGDQDVGISTICHVRFWENSKSSNVPRSTQDFLGNLTMKVNLKMDFSAVNQALDANAKAPILTNATMLLGIDVTHPGSTAMKGAPSVAAVVGSVDEEFAQWPASLHVNDVQKDGQKESNERVVHLAKMVYERLHDYYSRNSKVPDKIIVYRDGLSEGQFEMCKTMELPAIRAGVSQLLEQLRMPSRTNNFKMPPIILICAVKRHHTRLFPVDNAQNDSLLIGHGGIPRRNNASYNHNPLPGTLVNSHITYGENKDFFLISQKAIQGTARPTHYVILENETSFDQNQIARMTHNLCYLFGRATRSVGVCPAAYYADLAADRARCYVRNVYSPVNRIPYEAGQHAFNLHIHEDLKKTMFYI
ncbi:hypothetical protein A1O1_07040 [Capronia coronata CBS 617.96]|uniref:Piwi domain-containing protein n=1 Tax=Capronia coronata CBS 617.96 TaxID=1182541 RepID=W9XSA3_9EURO|nr:uncharacterized protein A1O1_07040 [Capronia coronata CBS 617.96]EXJ83417.1 hypothetical protein A1O1_07040 [Capronia coronata CBS 617.96]